MISIQSESVMNTLNIVTGTILTDVFEIYNNNLFIFFEEFLYFNVMNHKYFVQDIDFVSSGKNQLLQILRNWISEL